MLDMLSDKDKQLMGQYIKDNIELFDEEPDEWAILHKNIVDYCTGKTETTQFEIYAFCVDGMGQADFLPDITQFPVDKDKVKQLYEDITDDELMEIGRAWDFKHWWVNSELTSENRIDDVCLDLVIVCPKINSYHLFLWYLVQGAQGMRGNNFEKDTNIYVIT